jgi:hypothetical protein
VVACSGGDVFRILLEGLVAGGVAFAATHLQARLRQKRILMKREMDKLTFLN